MADKKISELTADASITGVEQVPVNDSGTTKRVALSEVSTYARSVTDAANGDYLARIKKTADAGYRLDLGLRFQGDPQILMGDGTTTDIRIRRRAAGLLEIDDSTVDDGPVHLRVGGDLTAGYSSGTPVFNVSQSAQRVAIGGGASSNLFTVGNQSPTQVAFIVGTDAFYIRAKTATNTSTLADTQSTMGYYAYYWNGSASTEVQGSITFRSTASAEGTFFFDVPNYELVTMYGATSTVEIMGDQGATVGLGLITSAHASRAKFQMDGATWGGASATPDTRIQRTAAKTLTFDDAAGGALTLFKVTGPVQVTGNIGFYNTSPAAKPTVTGSRAGNAALASLLTGLAGLGLLTDSSS